MTKKCDIDKVFKEKGKKLGFDLITAEYFPEREMKVNWTRTNRMIKLQVSDYLDEISDRCMGKLADMLLSRMVNQKDIGFPEELSEYLCSEEFRTRKVPVYLSRIPNVSIGPEGRSVDLRGSMERLVKMGLVEPDDALKLRWIPMGSSSDIGHSSIFMRTVCMNRRLDSAFIPEEVLDLCLFTQVLFVQLGFTTDFSQKIAEYQKRLQEFPDLDRIKTVVENAGLSIPC